MTCWRRRFDSTTFTQPIHFLLYLSYRVKHCCRLLGDCTFLNQKMLRRFLRNSADDDGTANNVAAGRTSTVSESSRVSTASFLETVTGMAHQRSTSTASDKAHEKLKDVLANTMKVEELMNFDAAVEAADSQASTSTGCAGRLPPLPPVDPTKRGIHARIP